MKREPSPQVMAAFLAKAKDGKEDDAQLAAFLDKDLADPLNLSGRNLRRSFAVAHAAFGGIRRRFLERISTKPI